MATIRSFEDLECWKNARGLCRNIGSLVDSGNFKNSYKLINQIDASSGSIMDNIAEGFERGTRGEFIQFLGYAKGSCGEFRSQLYRALDRDYLTVIQFDQLKQDAMIISSQIQAFISYLQKSNIEGVRKK